MKKIAFLCLLFFFIYSPVRSPAQTDTSNIAGVEARHGKLKNIYFSFIWFEAGNSFAMQEKKLLDLPYGMNKYFYNMKGGFSVNFFGLGVYYKDKFGVAAIFPHCDYGNKGTEFRDYISAKYPGYYMPDNMTTGNYTLGFINYRLCYKVHIKRFILEPYFQFGINDYSSFENKFVLKEIGSNQFVEYDVQKKDLKKNNYSYHLAFNFCRKFGAKNGNRLGAEAGIRAEYLIAPTDYQYTITETPYLMPPTIHSVEIKQLHPAFSIQVLVNLLF